MTVSDLASRVREAAPHAGRLLAAGVSQIRFLAGRFLLVTLVLVGALCGVLAVLFHRYVELARDLLIGRAMVGGVSSSDTHSASLQGGTV